MQDRIQTRSGRSKLPPRGWVKAKRTTVYKAPPPSRARRAFGFIFNIWTFLAALLVFLGLFLTFTYFWYEFSDEIDRRLLSGEVYTASAGIYTAPKTLRKGEAMSASELIDYLKTAGYIEKNNRADISRSRYSMENGSLIVDPGATATIDGAQAFNTLSISFEKDGKSVAKIKNLDLGKDEEKAKLEPRILSSIAAEGDGLAGGEIHASVLPTACTTGASAAIRSRKPCG